MWEYRCNLLLKITTGKFYRYVCRKYNFNIIFKNFNVHCTGKLLGVVYADWEAESWINVALLFSVSSIFVPNVPKKHLSCVRLFFQPCKRQGKNSRLLRFPMSPNIIFLLGLWEFHIIYPGNIHFPVLPGSPPTLMTFPPK